MIINEWIELIKNDFQRERIIEINNFIQKNFNNIKTEIKWNQLFYLLSKNGTFILAISISKNHISFAPENVAIKKFENEFKRNNYVYTKNIFKVDNNKNIDFELVKRIIKFNINDKKDLLSFWRSK